MSKPRALISKCTLRVLFFCLPFSFQVYNCTSIVLLQAVIGSGLINGVLQAEFPVHRS